MANHFKGTAIHEHHEKDIKDMKPLEWALMLLLFGMFFAGAGCIIARQFAIGVGCFGIFSMLFDVSLRVAFHKKSVVTQVFFVLGLFILLGGVLIGLRGLQVLIAYGSLLYCLIWLGVGILCWWLGSSKRKKMREYSTMVEADCLIVDSVSTNLFRFDDLPGTSYGNPINRSSINKPAFHYYVNGSEYYTESTVYYGDLNKGFQDGAKVTLEVNPKNPNDILPANTSSSMETIMGVFGLVLGGGGLIIWISLLVMGIICF